MERRAFTGPQPGFGKAPTRYTGVAQERGPSCSLEWHRRNLEVIPEIYDLQYSALSAAWLEHHLYTIEIEISDDLPQH